MQIIALGGGGFSAASEPGLDTYLLDQTGKPEPRIGFIGTASGDAESYLLKFYGRFGKLDCRPGHLPLFRRTPDLEAWMLGQDILFVGGGNTKSMLAVWRGWGLPEILRRAAEAGTILSGVSAGAVCWFEWGVTDSASDRLRPLACLGFVSGSCCPHYSGERDRRPSYEHMVAGSEIVPGYAIDDGAALHMIDGAAKRVVSGRADASVYRVERNGARAESRPCTDLERVDVAGPDERGQ
ncbi:MAG: peptidase E [bacterium]|nr:peptidase E [Deltaproteobacteria bacterium]MCP4903378.1 peptidase E [bacterium]